MTVCRALRGEDFVLRQGQMVPVFSATDYAPLVEALAIHTLAVSVDALGNPIPEEDAPTCDRRRYTVARSRSLSYEAAAFVSQVEHQPLGGVSGAYVSRLHDLDPIVGLDPGLPALGGSRAWESFPLSYRDASDKLLAYFPDEATPVRTWTVPRFYASCPVGGTYSGLNVMSGHFESVIPLPLPVLLRPLGGFNRSLRGNWTIDDVLNAVVRLVGCHLKATLYIGYGLLTEPRSETPRSLITPQDWVDSDEAGREVVLLERGPRGNGFRYVARSGWAMLHELLQGDRGGGLPASWSGFAVEVDDSLGLPPAELEASVELG